jgi:hypothetical protein
MLMSDGGVARGAKWWLCSRPGWLGDLVIMLTSGLIGERSKVVKIKGSVVTEIESVKAAGGGATVEKNPNLYFKFKFEGEERE